MYKRKFIFIFFVFFCIFYNCFSQNTFRKLYKYNAVNIPYPELVADFRSTNDGGYIAAVSQSDILLNSIVIKIDSFGDPEWTFKIQGTSIGICQMNDSSYLFASLNSNEYKSYIVSLNQSGNINWMKKINDSLGAPFLSGGIKKWDDSTAIIYNNVQSVWISSNGVIANQKSVSGNANSGIGLYYDGTPAYIRQNSNYYIYGSDSRTELAFHDSTGNRIWGKRYYITEPLSGTLMSSASRQMKTALNGDLIMINECHESHLNISSSVFCTDSSGNVKWSRLFEQTEISDVIMMPDSTLKLVGFSYNHSIDTYQASFIMDFDPNQNSHRTRYFLFPPRSQRKVIGFYDESENRFLLASSTMFDFFEVIKTDTSISSNCADSIAYVNSTLGLVNDSIFSFGIIQKNYILSDTMITGTHAYTVTDNCITNNVVENIVTDFLIYPNPGTNTIIIEGMNESEKIFLEIIDASGRVIKKEKANLKYVSIEDLLPGLYTLKLILPHQTLAKRFFKM